MLQFSKCPFWSYTVCSIFRCINDNVWGIFSKQFCGLYLNILDIFCYSTSIATCSGMKCQHQFLLSGSAPWVLQASSFILSSVSSDKVPFPSSFLKLKQYFWFSLPTSSLQLCSINGSPFLISSMLLTGACHQKTLF